MIKDGRQVSQHVHLISKVRDQIFIRMINSVLKWRHWLSGPPSMYFNHQNKINCPMLDLNTKLLLRWVGKLICPPAWRDFYTSSPRPTITNMLVFYSHFNALQATNFTVEILWPIYCWDFHEKLSFGSDWWSVVSCSVGSLLLKSGFLPQESTW